MIIRECKVNHLDNPIGYRMENTVFSWIADGISKEAKIVVEENKKCVADTGFCELNALATRLDIDLKSRTQYEWVVSVKDEKGEITQSGRNTFETGKLDEAWSGKWIGCDDTVKRLPIFYTEWENCKEVKSARLYISGLGLYEAGIDKKRIGDAYFTPGFTAYNSFIQAQTYNVTELVSLKGRHEIAVLVGDGWYKSRIQFGSPKGGFYGKDYRLIAELHICYQDGTKEIIATDESWKIKRSNVIFTGIYDGEHWDDTKEPLKCERVSLLEPPKGELTDNLSVPVKAHEIFEGKIVYSNGSENNLNGETVLDIGQNLAGTFSLRLHVKKGQEVLLQFGEVLQDGKFYRDNLRSAKAEFLYVSDGKEHILTPHFTFYGFRYVRITGINNFNPKDFKAYALYSDVTKRATLLTGDERVNKLILNSSWGMKSNFVDLPTDCPQRDERMGWTGDAEVFCETASFLADTYAFYRKYLYDMQKEQEANNGLVPDIVPAVGFNTKKGSAAWGDATCIIPWTMYIYSGDIAILKEHYDSMKAWVDYIERLDGNTHGWREVSHYGDWLALDAMNGDKGQQRGATDEGFIADVYYRKSALLVVKAAALLNKTEDVKKYGQLAEKILKGIREEYFSPKGRCCIKTQTAALLTLEESLDDENRALSMLIELLEKNRDRLTTGFIGTSLLCKTLTKYGYIDKAFKLLLNEEYPGWLYEVKLGATTIWERWNSLDETGHISSTGMNSLNHYAYGAITGWLFKEVAGIQVREETPGFRSVDIKPQVNWTLKRVSAVVSSPAGTYEVSWKIIDLTHVHFRAVVPYNCEAVAYLPKSKIVKQIMGGEIYEITYETDTPLARNYSIADKLSELVSVEDCYNILKEDLPILNEILIHGEYPLSETLTNLYCDKAIMDRIDKRLKEVWK